jgi:hypothetical protein
MIKLYKQICQMTRCNATLAASLGLNKVSVVVILVQTFYFMWVHFISMFI